MPTDKPTFPEDSEIPPLGSPAHDERLIDVSVEETFPASDPPFTMMPGNTLSINDVAREKRYKKK